MSPTCAGGTPRRSGTTAEAEQAFAIGKTKKMPEPTAPQLELELAGAMRAIEVLEREIVASGRRLFAAALEHVPGGVGGARARGSTSDDDRVAEHIARGRRSPCSTSAPVRGAETGWFSQCTFEVVACAVLAAHGG